MSIKGILLVLSLYLGVVWVGALYLQPHDFIHTGQLFTLIGLGTALGLALLAWLYGFWKVQRAKAAAKPKQAAAPTSTDHPDDRALRDLLREARIRLAEAPGFADKTSPDIFSGRSLYLIVGPEGSGKTQSFANSGLEPQLLATQDRLANIWLLSDALFIEFSGRHFEGSADRWEQLLRVAAERPTNSRWEQWLQRLNTSNPGAELKGILLVCDTKTLQIANADQLQTFGQLCQTRFWSIIKVFRRRVPVYTLFAKSDQITYFPDFVSRFTEKEADNILGCTLALNDGVADASPDVFVDAEARRLTRSFHAMYRSIVERRLTALFHDPVPSRKPNIFEFPREFARVRSNLVALLVRCFRPNPLHIGPVNRGFYFCGRREGAVARPGPDPTGPGGETMWETMAVGATQIFKGDATVFAATLEPERGRGNGGNSGFRWMFIADLLRDVVLADHALGASAEIRNTARSPRITALLYAGAAVGIVFSLTLVGSWIGNRQLLHRVNEAALKMESDPGLPNVQQLSRLDALRQQVEVLRNGPPLHLRWGLYAGNSVRDAARAGYFRRLKALLLENVNARITGVLASLPQSGDQATLPSEVVTGQLKTHLMISSGVCAPDAPLVSQQLRAALLDLGYREGDERFRLAARQVDYYASELPYGNPAPLAFSQPARDRAVQYLSAFAGIDRYYRSLMSQVEGSGLPALSLKDLAPDYQKVMSGPASFPASFTPAGWEKLNGLLHSGKVTAEADACLARLSSTAASFKMGTGGERQIESLYAADVLSNWRKYLSQFGVLPYRSREDAVQKLELLEGHSSPLLALMKQISDGTQFAAPAPESGSQVPGILRKFIPEKKAGDLAARLKTYKPQTPDQMRIGDIDTAFQPARAVVPPQSERWVNEKNTDYMDSLTALRAALLAMTRSTSETMDPQLSQAALLAHDKALESVTKLAKAFNPESVGGIDKLAVRLLNEPITNARKWIPNPEDPEQTQKKKMEGAMATFCVAFKPLLHKYPFDANGPDAGVKEVMDYFAPGQGKLWKFQSAALNELVVREGVSWKPNPAAQKLKPSPELIAFLDKSQQITRAFYPEGADSPRLVYTLRPKIDSASDQVIRLRIDGRQRDFSAGSVLREQFIWTEKPAEAVGRTGTQSFSAPFSSHDGPWAVFRLFGDAEPRAIRSALVEWKRARGASGRFEAIEPPVRLEFVSFPGDADLFNPAFFAGYECPKRATQ